MKYTNGQEVRVGDCMRMGMTAAGSLCSRYGLIHFVEDDEDLELLSRATREGGAE